MATAAPEQIPSRTTGQLKLQETKRGKVYIGELTPEFLRIQPAAVAQSSSARNNHSLPQQQFPQQMMTQPMTMVVTNKLTITVIEAKLNKNYGRIKMDPYCRVRVGHAVFETTTAQHKAKLPYWGKTMTTVVPDGIKDVDIEIFDERAFSNDNRIAWGKVALSDSLKCGKAEDEWWPLSGKLGEEKEGVIHLQLSWTKEQRPMYYNRPMPMIMPPMVMQPQGYGIPPSFAMGGVPVMPQAQIQTPVVTEQDLRQMKEMFPDMDDDVIKTVLEASRGNKDAAINSLLSMQC